MTTPLTDLAVAQALLAQKAEIERLRKLVRRLVTDWEPFINDGPLSYPDERQRAATIREAMAALEGKEAQP